MVYLRRMGGSKYVVNDIEIVLIFIAWGRKISFPTNVMK